MAIEGILTDEHLLRLSQRLTNYGNLRCLAYTGLKVKHHQIESAITNNPNDVQSAACGILQIWMKQYESREEAFNHLYLALTASQLNMLAQELMEWGEEKIITTEPKQILTKFCLTKLSQSFSSIGEVRTLAYRGLRLDPSVIELTISDEAEGYQVIAEKILLIWLKKQTDSEAFVKLQDALKECDMLPLARKLKQWAENVDVETHRAERLTDLHITQICCQITNVGKLRDLAYKGLQLEYHEIESAISNKPHDIQSAAHDVLHTWYGQQTDRGQAFLIFQDALHKCHLSMPTEGNEVVTEASEYFAIIKLLLVLTKNKLFNCNYNSRKGTKEYSFFSGLKQIQTWTKESLREKPFCTAKGKVWTEMPSNIPLEKIFTKLRWVRKIRDISFISLQDLEDISDLWNNDLDDLKDISDLVNEEKIKETGPVLIGVTGKCFKLYNYSLFQTK